MTGLLFAVALVVAVGAALRSTWSPCGLSMMSTITPFGERARGHRYGVTASWYLVGALVGGLTSGALAAVLAAVWSATGLAGHPTVAGIIAGAVALAGALVDGDLFGGVLPLVRRQVDDGWVNKYRPWVYGSGFGWQIGTGVATYLMTSAVVVWIVAAVVSGSPGAALAVGAVFGLARGSTVLATRGAVTPDRLRALHARLERIGRGVQISVVATLGATGGLLLGHSVVVASGEAHSPAGTLVSVLAAAGCGLLAVLAAVVSKRRTPTCSTAGPSADLGPARLGVPGTAAR